MVVAAVLYRPCAVDVFFSFSVVSCLPPYKPLFGRWSFHASGIMVVCRRCRLLSRAAAHGDRRRWTGTPNTKRSACLGVVVAVLVVVTVAVVPFFFFFWGVRWNPRWAGVVPGAFWSVCSSVGGVVG